MWKFLPDRSTFDAKDLDGTITDDGELTHSYSVESNNEVKVTKHEIIQMIQRAGFDPSNATPSTTASPQCKFVVEFCVE